MCDLLIKLTTFRAGWKFVLMADGVLSVTMNGMKLMQLLHADNWDTQHGVSSSDRKCTNELLFVCTDRSL